MLEAAKQKGIYRDLMQANIDPDKLNIPDIKWAVTLYIFYQQISNYRQNMYLSLFPLYNFNLHWKLLIFVYFETQYLWNIDGKHTLFYSPLLWFSLLIKHIDFSRT